jgi:acetoacetyl-CoA reductase
MTQRVAVVTGGTGTIGTEICRQLGAAGCRVAAICHPAAPDCQAAEWEGARRAEGYEMRVFACDLADFDATAAVLRDIEQDLGAVDILVNAAGITRDGTMRRMTFQQWREVLGANLDSVFNTTRNVMEGMLTRGWGRIINISSVNGQKGQFGQANYAASKAGMHGFTMSVAQEGARKGVTANTISPGYIESPMIMKVPEDVRAKILEGIPVGRFGKPSEIARLVAYLASEESGFMTGADLSINGGQHMG